MALKLDGSVKIRTKEQLLEQGFDIQIFETSDRWIKIAKQLFDVDDVCKLTTEQWKLIKKELEVQLVAQKARKARKITSRSLSLESLDPRAIK